MVWQLTFWIGGALAVGALFCGDTRYELGRSAFAVHTLAPAVVAALVAFVVARRDAAAATRPPHPVAARERLAALARE